MQTKYKAIKQTIHCVRSGIPLLQVETLCSNGWPLLTTSQIVGICHPAYQMPLTKLLLVLNEQLDQLEDMEYKTTGEEAESVVWTETGLTMSAIMHQLEAIYLPPYGTPPSLPSKTVVVGSAKRLFDLASWYHHATSKRMRFPQYSISKMNSNLQWDNFGTWLDDAHVIKKEWAVGVATHDVNQDLVDRLAAQEEVSASSVYKKIDFNKVWGWIASQVLADGRYAAGRLVTWKDMFMNGPNRPEDWTADDLDDLQIAVTECCDTGNDISAFIAKRLNTIRAGIEDFYSSFTLLSSTKTIKHTDEVTKLEADTTNAFLSSFDDQLVNITELPAAPNRVDFPTLGAFLQAQAKYNILSKRFKLLSANSKQATTEAAPVSGEQE